MSLDIANTAHVSLQVALDSIKSAVAQSIGVRYCMILVKFDEELEIEDGFQAPYFIKLSVGKDAKDAEETLREVEGDFPIAIKVVRQVLKHDALSRRSQRG